MERECECGALDATGHVWKTLTWLTAVGSFSVPIEACYLLHTHIPVHWANFILGAKV